MPAALTSHSSSGAATTAAPTPAVLSTSSTHQPTGTARTKRSAGRRPWLAARAVDSVVLGPGLKLMEAASSSKAVSSDGGMRRWPRRSPYRRQGLLGRRARQAFLAARKHEK